MECSKIRIFSSLGLPLIFTYHLYNIIRVRLSLKNENFYSTVCNVIRERDSSTGVSLWILQCFSQLLSYITPPDDSFCLINKCLINKEIFVKE